MSVVGWSQNYLISNVFSGFYFLVYTSKKNQILFGKNRNLSYASRFQHTCEPSFTFFVLKIHSEKIRTGVRISSVNSPAINLSTLCKKHKSFSNRAKTQLLRIPKDCFPEHECFQYLNKFYELTKTQYVITTPNLTNRKSTKEKNTCLAYKTKIYKL